MSLVKLFGNSLAVSAAFAAGTASAAGETFMNGRSIYGQPVQGAAGAPVINVATKTVNVRCGDIVTFVSGGKSFSWKFDVATHRAVSLAKIAPADFGPVSQTIYVSRNDSERGG